MRVREAQKPKGSNANRPSLKQTRIPTVDRAGHRGADRQRKRSACVAEACYNFAALWIALQTCIRLVLQ